MTDISTNYKKFNMHPGSRVLKGEYKKVIIVVTGKSLIGKSTICEKILNDNINYISMDAVCVKGEYNLKEMETFVKLWKYDCKADIELSESCCMLFVDYFFEKYIKDNDNLNILIDGYLFTLKRIYDYFLKKCESYGYRVWKMERIL